MDSKAIGKTTRDEFKSCLIKTSDDMVRNFPTAREFDPPMLLQEYCQGAGVGVEMLVDKGKCLSVFQHRRLQELPYSGGVAVTAIAEPPNPALVQSSLALLRALRWSGIAMVEFKVDPADGQAVLMEVNGRYWGTISLPVMAGIDFPLYHWKLVHGEMPVTPSEYAAGTKWRWTVGCIARLHGLLSASLGSGEARTALLLTLKHLPAVFNSSIHDALFDVSDPMPAVFELLNALKYYCLHDMKMLFKRSRAESPDPIGR
jgi:predicted ATP-grasp superfamily ATP-dependent carboligase